MAQGGYLPHLDVLLCKLPAKREGSDCARRDTPIQSRVRYELMREAKPSVEVAGCAEPDGESSALPHAILFHGGRIELNAQPRPIGKRDKPMAVGGNWFLKEILPQGIRVLVELQNKAVWNGCQ
jgi:hypothetical protein